MSKNTKSMNISERDLTKRLVRNKFCSHIGIILTERCNITCRHCYFECTSKPNNIWNQKKLNQIIKELKKIPSVNIIGFSGGEPFLEFKLLKNSIEVCYQLNLKSTVVTNGYWAVNFSETKIMLERLKGLTSITVSADMFHQEFIPIQNVRNVILAANQLQVECHIQTCHLNDPQQEISEIKSILKDCDGLFSHSSQPVQLYGRASKNLEQNQIYSYDATRMVCPAADNILIFPNGDVFGCCNPPRTCGKKNPLYIGNINHISINKIWKLAEKNPIIHVLRLWGPIELIKIMQEAAKKTQIRIAPPSTLEKEELCSLCRYILEDEFKTEIVKNALSQEGALHKIAVSRLIKFGEKSMLADEEPTTNNCG